MMTNKEWLKEKKNNDEKDARLSYKQKFSFIKALNEKELLYRQVKALEIIAEEIIRINEKVELILVHPETGGKGEEAANDKKSETN